MLFQKKDEDHLFDDIDDNMENVEDNHNKDDHNDHLNKNYFKSTSFSSLNLHILKDVQV